MRETIPKLIDEVEADEKQKAALEALFKAINGGFDDSGAAATVQHVFREHNTLQQSFMRTVIIPFIRYYKWAREEGRGIDGRNDATAILCDEFNKVLDELGDYPPLI